MKDQGNWFSSTCVYLASFPGRAQIFGCTTVLRMHTCVLRVKINTAARVCFSVHSGIHFWPLAERLCSRARDRERVLLYAVCSLWSYQLLDLEAPELLLSIGVLLSVPSWIMPMMNASLYYSVSAICYMLYVVIYVPDVQKWLVDVLNPITSWLLDQIRDVDER